MEFFEAVERRRSIRRFLPEVFPDGIVEKALQAAVLAPNSSNTQTWGFHWVKGETMKQKVVHSCLDQSAARTAAHLIVVTADPKLWRRSQQSLLQWVQNASAPKQVVLYYEKIVPYVYRWGLFNCLAPVKWLLSNVTGLFRPMVRGPYSRRDIEVVAIKSAALAAENFVLAISAQGGASCMMEGFDDFRLRRILKLKCSTRIVMVIGVGMEAPRGTWGPRFRLPLESVVQKYE